MCVFDQTNPDNIQRRELHLSLLTCSAILVLGAGVAALMYSAIFLGPVASGRFPHIAIFVGFCVLGVLLTVYVWDRYRIIRHLRRQLTIGQKLMANVQADASMELLNALPDYELFQDYLPMEVCRAMATLSELSVLVLTITMSPQLNSSERTRLFSNVAEALSAKLQEHSIYVLAPSTCFGIVMPNVGLVAATHTSDCIADELTSIRRASKHMSYWMNVINYPNQASNAGQLLRMIQKLVPEDRLEQLPKGG
jgi:hypothetical protein